MRRTTNGAIRCSCDSLTKQSAVYFVPQSGPSNQNGGRFRKHTDDVVDLVVHPQLASDDCVDAPWLPRRKGMAEEDDLVPAGRAVGLREQAAAGCGLFRAPRRTKASRSSRRRSRLGFPDRPCTPMAERERPTRTRRSSPAGRRSSAPTCRRARRRRLESRRRERPPGAIQDRAGVGTAPSGQPRRWPCWRRGRRRGSGSPPRSTRGPWRALSVRTRKSCRSAFHCRPYCSLSALNGSAIPARQAGTKAATVPMINSVSRGGERDRIHAFTP